MTSLNYLRYLSGAPAAKYDVGRSMNSLRNDRLKSWGLTSSRKTSYLQKIHCIDNSVLVTNGPAFYVGKFTVRVTEDLQINVSLGNHKIKKCVALLYV